MTPISLPVVREASDGNHISQEVLTRELRAKIDGEVRFGVHDRMLYSTDASIYQVEPIGVVVPISIPDAVKAVNCCIAHGVPILPRGGGTSLAGQTVNRAVVIDFSAKCRALLSVDKDRMRARVEPGIVLDHLNRALAPTGLMFGPDVATSGHANVGGMIGNNSAGAQSVLYGRTVEHVEGLEVMLGDGRRMRLEQGAAERDSLVAVLTKQVADVVLRLERAIDDRYPKIVRHVDGYNLDLILEQLRRCRPGRLDAINLAKLVCGSEGTLAVTLEAELNLVPVPKRSGLGIVSFDSVDDALGALVEILESKPSAIELIDEVVIRLARQNTEYRHYVDLLPKAQRGDAGAVLYVGYHAETTEELNLKLAALKERFSAGRVHAYTAVSEIQRAWKLRKAGEPLLHGLPGDRKPLTFVEDTAVAPQHLQAFVREFRDIVARHGTTAAYYAHASVGCLHIRPLIDIRQRDDVTAMRRIAEEVTDLVIKYKGALSGEHGDGRVRGMFLERYFGKELCDGFREIKRIFDPRGLLNPGMIVDPGDIAEKLRIKPVAHHVHVPEVSTFFSYEREHGFSSAVEMCNGAGICRRIHGGVMCPSYRALLDERHATRGRGNALRLAITGQFEERAQARWGDTETIKTLDLCLSCKACKTECPSNVDIAKLKAEYLAQSYSRGGKIPAAARLFGRVRTLNTWGSRFHWLANAVNRTGLVKNILSRFVGVDHRRSVPTFAQSLYSWNARRTPTVVKGPVVVLFPDCFTTYNEPETGKAAIRSLEALGYRVALPKLGCCGRSMISLGLLKNATVTASRTADDLAECVARERAIAVVGCEPSCVSAIKDDWLDLKLALGRDALASLASRTWLVEEFIERCWNDHPRIPERPPAQLPHEIIFHGHCHQKALWGTESSGRLLRRIAGDRLSVLDSGCCGMAGSFGYMRNKYDLSMAIGEQSLFGSLREKPHATVAATGTSCRQQIADGLGRAAVHPIQLFDAWLNHRTSKTS